MSDNKPQTVLSPELESLRRRLNVGIWNPLQKLVEWEAAVRAGESPEPIHDTLGVAETSVLLGVSDSTVRRYIRSGHLDACCYPDLVCVYVYSIAEFLLNPSFRNAGGR